MDLATASSPMKVPTLQALCIRKLMSLRVSRDDLLPLYNIIGPICNDVSTIGFKNKVFDDIKSYYSFFLHRHGKDFLEEILGVDEVAVMHKLHEEVKKKLK